MRTPTGISLDLFRYDRTIGKYVQRKPYYVEGLRLLPHPWHYTIFSQLAFYRWLIGGVWYCNQGCWTRMEDRRADEFCHDHLTMEPCEYCKLESDHLV